MGLTQRIEGVNAAWGKFTEVMTLHDRAHPEAPSFLNSSLNLINLVVVTILYQKKKKDKYNNP